VEHPLVSVRDSLVPTAVVQVKAFQAPTTAKLERAINEWVAETQNLVVCPGPLTQTGREATVIVTYVSAGENRDSVRSGEMEHSNVDVSKKRSNVSSAESDGFRIA